MTRRRSPSATLGTCAALVLLALVTQRAGAQAIVRGEVFDSLLTFAPLQGATIVVQGTTLTATSDKRGQFAIRDLPAGQYTIGFFHPLLDSLQVGAPRQVIDVGERGTVRVTLATPSARAVARGLCGAEPARATSVVFGFVRAVEDAAPLDSAELIVRWFELEMRGIETRNFERRVSARSGADGLYVLCDVPNDIAVSMVAVHGEQASGPLHLGLDASGIARRDVRVSLSDPAARWLGQSAAGDSVSAAREPGTARLQVMVRNAQGRPVRGAVVGIRGTASSGSSNDSGSLVLSGVPAGSQTLAVRAIGLAPSFQVVTLTPGERLSVVAKLERTPVLLATISVVDQRPSQFEAEIKARIASGWGVLVEGPALRNASTGLGFWAGIPGMSVGRAANGPNALPMMKIGSDDSCVPDIWMDGNQMYSIDGWEFRALLMNAKRMEVFTRQSRVPAQYRTTSNCGAILVWTY